MYQNITDRFDPVYRQLIRRPVCKTCYEVIRVDLTFRKNKTCINVNIVYGR
jgi:hypothetical protein